MRSAPQTVDVKQFIDDRPVSLYQWFVIAVCFLILTIDAYDVVAIGFAGPSFIGEWHITKAQLGTAISAGVLGMTVGALLGGPLSDWTSPKRVLIVMLMTSAVGSILTAFVGGVGALTGLRFVTGIGLGAAMPVGLTLVHEYAPTRRGSLLVNFVNCGVMLGAAACGVVAGIVIPVYGWGSIFIIGGVIPLGLAIAAIFVLPEPLRFMVSRNWPAQRVAAVMRRIAPDVAFDSSHFVLSEDEQSQKKVGVAVILSPGFLFGTLMLWCAYSSACFVFYLLNGWMPLLIRDSGATLSQASFITSLYPLGGALGALCLGWLMGRFEKNTVVAIAVAGGGVALWILGGQKGNLGLLAASTFAAGMCVNGALMSMASLAATFYSSSGRTTGISWMNGVGRFGGMLGPLAGGLMLKANVDVSTMFALLAVPMLIQAAALLLKRSAAARTGALEYPSNLA
ncbi:4-hydroxybenzoate transporter PcaK [Paraburkholderia caffeinitolerans]|uniref:4-hydroxybenzoate transporter PcaK n=2 Tax=Paraburkholderia caffeinitolerans TaxID=1723730 RepID=A0A6J5G0M5_9BURK|nr:4-hydroxybenzoate transporter PcaK [Paraburkholderia caffeinitolerans]